MIQSTVIRWWIIQISLRLLSALKQFVVAWTINIKSPSLLSSLSSSSSLSLRIEHLFLFQNDLDHVVHLWNTHRIRRTRHQTAPSGKPFTLYYLPEAYGGHHHVCPVSSEQIDGCLRYVSRKACYLTCLIMTENNKSQPCDAQQAITLYRFLREIVLQELYN